MAISPDMIVRIAHADVLMRMAFPRSVAHWHGERGETRPMKVLAGDCGPLLLGKDDAVEIDGNCSNPVSAPDDNIIHIYGNLSSTINVAGHNEIIITGSVDRNATIDATGFCHLFVGGAFSGELRTSGSARIWIEGDFVGTIKTGNPSTELYIGRHFWGNTIPGDRAALLWLTVGGFASHASMSKIVDCRYTQFNASIAQSNVAPGLYPRNGHLVKTSSGNSFNRWCVQTEHRDGPTPAPRSTA